jgi:hypothetical protein
MSVIIAGATTGQGAEVEAGTAALRAVLRPQDYGALGSYRKAMTSGTIAAGLAAASAVFGFRWAPGAGGQLALIKHIQVSMGDLAGFTAGLVALNAFVARPYTVLDVTGGTQGTFTGNNGKLRTSMATTAGATCAISTTAAISGGTSTLDTDPFATVSGSVLATAGNPPIVNGFDLWGPLPGEQPLVLANNEGFIIKATVPATGTWQLGVAVQWDEVAAF